jgi:hypothetical protein
MVLTLALIALDLKEAIIGMGPLSDAAAKAIENADQRVNEIVAEAEKWDGANG